MRIGLVSSERPGEAGASAFFIEVLAGLGDVTVIEAPPGRLGMADDGIVARFLAERFDRWVFWQAETVAARLVGLGLRGAVLVPAVDVARPDEFWRQFVAARFITFSYALHARLQALDCNTAVFEFWPEPRPVAERAASDGRSAFFWERRPLDVPNVTTVAQQCEALGIGRLHVHAVPDRAGDGPGGYAALGMLSGVALTSTAAFADAAEAERVAGAAQFWFAPTLGAGIAGAHLEAMSRGQVVIAPDVAPLNEAVGHLASGVLYDAQRPLALPALSQGRIEELAAAASQRVVEGRREWEADRPRLVSLLAGDGERWPASDRSASFVREIQRGVRRRRLAATRTIGSG